MSLVCPYNISRNSLLESHSQRQFDIEEQNTFFVFFLSEDVPRLKKLHRWAHERRDQDLKGISQSFRFLFYLQAPSSI
jgi:hypothetical protein